MDILRVKLVQKNRTTKGQSNDEIQALLQVMQRLLFLLEPQKWACAKQCRTMVGIQLGSSVAGVSSCVLFIVHGSLIYANQKIRQFNKY